MNMNKPALRSGSTARKFLMIVALVVACTAGGLLYVRSGKPQRDFIRENLATISESESAADALGAPMVLGESVATRSGKQITVKTPVTGSKASGTLVLTGTLEESAWVKKKLYLDVEGNQIDLEELDDILGLEIFEGD